MKNEGNPSDFRFLKVDGVIGESLREREREREREGERDLCKRERDERIERMGGMREMSLKDQYFVF